MVSEQWFYSHSTGAAHQPLRLTTMLLNDNNYPSWTRSVSLSLQGKCMLSYITGTIKKTVSEESEIVPAKIISTKTVPKDQLEPKTKSAPATKIITTPTVSNWDQHNINVMNWLLNSMEPQISQLFMYCESAKEIWDETKEMFSQEHNFAYIFHLKQEILQIK
jgi:gag-polypeptide of LTR copia-type